MGNIKEKCEQCGAGPFETDAEFWNHPCPDRETTLQRSTTELIGYDTKTDAPVYAPRELPKVGDILDRPGDRKARVMTAQVRDGSQIIGLRYID